VIFRLSKLHILIIKQPNFNHGCMVIREERVIEGGAVLLQKAQTPNVQMAKGKRQNAIREYEMGKGNSGCER
jgi:hypothetical protein